MIIYISCMSHQAKLLWKKSFFFVNFKEKVKSRGLTGFHKDN